jgi:hypothetical protein
MFYNFKESDLDKYIYRIISLERLLELFSTEKNTLAKPEKWEDTFENFILKSKVQLLSGEVVEYNIHERIYGQCWTLHNASDAMWRIYSPNKDGLRIRTTVRRLLESIYEAHPRLPEAKCCLGKVEYLTQNGLMEYANNTFDDSGISVENIFRSLLIKRKAFKHEAEVRLLYDAWDENSSVNKLYIYKIDPHNLISQIMIDPRRSYSEFKTIKLIIEKATGYKGSIKRSLLYSLPKERVLNVTNILGRE